MVEMIMENTESISFNQTLIGKTDSMPFNHMQIIEKKKWYSINNPETLMFF